MNFRDNDIVFLLGAGASADAGIPTSQKMMGNIEKSIGADPAWNEYSGIYDYMKRALVYSEIMKTQFDNKLASRELSHLNIEQLVNALSELEKKEDHIIYPFIGSWNIKLVEVGGSGFEKLVKFKKLIINQLKTWVTIKDYSKANYYSKFNAFQQELTHALQIFSLNYDLCLEHNCTEVNLERGFGKDRRWDWRRFDDSNPEEVNVYLYKLHGSIDWEPDETTGSITVSDEVFHIDKAALIFGTNYKLQYIDPFLFLMYQFRRRCLESRLIVTIGYGFGDEHINGILGQALGKNPDRKLYCTGLELDKEKVLESLNIETDDPDNPNRITIFESNAKLFFEKELKLENFAKLFPESRQDEPF